MDCDPNIVRLTYKELKEMAEGNNREEVAQGVYNYIIKKLILLTVTDSINSVF